MVDLSGTGRHRGAVAGGRGVAERRHGGDDGSGGDAVQAGVAGHRAVPGPGQAAGRVLVAEQHDGHAVRRPALRRDDGGEERDDRRADGGGQVGGPGVGRDDDLGPGEHGGEPGEVDGAGEVEGEPVAPRTR